MPPEHLAALIAAAVEDRRSTLVPGPGNRLIARIGKVAPALTEYLMRKTILEKLPHSRKATAYPAGAERS
jgi:hypothetical protein